LKVKIPEKVELTKEELESFLWRIEKNPLMTDFDKKLCRKSIQFNLWLLDKLEHGKLVISKLRRLLFGSKSEKRKKRLKSSPDKESSEKEKSIEVETSHQVAVLKTPIETEKKGKGHGRMSADVYVDARTEFISHITLKAGDPCPKLLCTGRLYNFDPGVVIRIKGRSPADIIRYEIRKLRCSLCGSVSNPVLPEDFGEDKYDAYFKAQLAVQKYFVAVPFYRQEKYHEMINFPLPDATQLCPSGKFV